MNAPDSILQKALERIGKFEKGIRSDTLAAMINIDQDELEVTLQPLVKEGKLLTCNIQRPGKPDVIEYRCPLAGLPGKFLFERTAPAVNAARRPIFPTRPSLEDQKFVEPQAKAADNAAPANPGTGKESWPRSTSKQRKALDHLELHGPSNKEALAGVMGIKAGAVSAYMTPLMSKGFVVAQKASVDGHPPSNTYRLADQAQQSSTPTPAGEQGQPAIEPSEPASSEGIDTATQPSSPAATPPDSSDEGQCLQKGEAPLTHALITAARPHPEATHLSVRRCGFAMDDEGFIGIGDGYGNVKLSPADVEAFITWAERARSLWQPPPSA